MDLNEIKKALYLEIPHRNQQIEFLVDAIGRVSHFSVQIVCNVLVNHIFIFL